jgi:hypothetical protein
MQRIFGPPSCGPPGDLRIDRALPGPAPVQALFPFVLEERSALAEPRTAPVRRLHARLTGCGRRSVAGPRAPRRLSPPGHAATRRNPKPAALSGHLQRREAVTHRSRCLVDARSPRALAFRHDRTNSRTASAPRHRPGQAASDILRVWWPCRGFSRQPAGGVQAVSQLGAAAPR